jgi:hypothetical protein
MACLKGTNPKHPKLGVAIKVEPIRTKKAISDIKQLLGRSPRHLYLFTLGINTAYRANVIVTLLNPVGHYTNPNKRF